MNVTHEGERLREYERWYGSASPSALAFRFWMSQAGAFLVNAPVFQLKENLRLEPWMRVLDIGCGRASALRILDGRVQFEHTPVGLDFSKSVLRQAHADGRLHERPLHLVRGSAVRLPFADETFDFVMSSYVVKHLDEGGAQELVGEIHRVLAPGGLALLWDFAPTGNDRLDHWNKGVVSRGVHVPHFRSTRALMALGELAGFGYIRPARLRPFLLPPIPRASVLLGKPPEGWQGR